MAQPASRQEFIDYCKRQLGAPVLEVNVAEEQISDLIDDAIQHFNERHFDGVAQMYLKYQVTQEDIDRGSAPNDTQVGIVTTNTSATIAGVSTSFKWEETSNYLQVPSSIIGVTKVFHFDGSNTMSSGMFSMKYQLFLNDIHYWGNTELLTYSMLKRYLEDIDFLLTTEKQIRFNQRMDRLYLDIDWQSISVGDWLIMDCFRALNPADFSRVWNDSFLKPYATALIKRQWGQNLSKFSGTAMLGGVTLNGPELFSTALVEVQKLEEEIRLNYEEPAHMQQG